MYSTNLFVRNKLPKYNILQIFHPINCIFIIEFSLLLLIIPSISIFTTAFQASSSIIVLTFLFKRNIIKAKDQQG